MAGEITNLIGIKTKPASVAGFAEKAAAGNAALGWLEILDVVEVALVGWSCGTFPILTH